MCWNKMPFDNKLWEPNEKNLDYLSKSDTEIKLKTYHSYFTQCIHSNDRKQQKIVLLCCMETPSNWYYKFWWHSMKGY